MSFLQRLFGRRPDTPAAEWLARRATADPESVIREHFAALVAHDLDWILATLSPERARLYQLPTTLDKRRQTVQDARVLSVAVATDHVVLPSHYPDQAVFRVDFELDLVESEERRDPTLQAGQQWGYFVLVREGPKKPWMIADWGR